MTCHCDIQFKGYSWVELEDVVRISRFYIPQDSSLQGQSSSNTMSPLSVTHQLPSCGNYSLMNQYDVLVPPESSDPAWSSTLKMQALVFK